MSTDRRDSGGSALAAATPASPAAHVNHPKQRSKTQRQDRAKGGLHVMSDAERRVSEAQQAEAEATGIRRGRRSRVRPKNWGYTTYLDKVFGLRCFEDLVRMRVFPDAKDISESYGVLQAAIRRGMAPAAVAAAGQKNTKNKQQQQQKKKKKPKPPKQERRAGVLLISVGDGSTARTATLAAFLTSWTCVSVDPCLRPEWAGRHPHGVGRLHGAALRFEEWMADADALRALRAEVEAADATATAAAAARNADEAGTEAAAAAVEGGAAPAAAAPVPDDDDNDDDETAGPAAVDDNAVLAFAKAHRQLWVDWLAEDAAGRQLQGSKPGTVLLDPRRYSVETRRAFHDTAAAAADSAAAAAAAAAAANAGTAAETVDSAEGGVGRVRQLVLLGVHAHNRYSPQVDGDASIAAVREAFGNPPTCLVSLPCCHRFNPTKDVGRAPDEEFSDEAIFSACRRVLVWRWPRGPTAGAVPRRERLRAMQAAATAEAKRIQAELDAVATAGNGGVVVGGGVKEQKQALRLDKLQRRLDQVVRRREVLEAELAAACRE